jgi:hypothetical protein
MGKKFCLRSILLEVLINRGGENSIIAPPFKFLVSIMRMCWYYCQTYPCRHIGVIKVFLLARENFKIIIKMS